VTKYLVLWHRSAAWPTDPAEESKIIQKTGSAIDDDMKKGKIKEHGHFLDGNSGYTIWETEGIDIFRNLIMTSPYYEYEIHEMIPFEKSRGIVKEVFKVSAEAAKK
jgi:hypothetical protein